MVVRDEAQNIENAATNSAQVPGERNAKYRLCLAGTPMENNLGENMMKTSGFSPAWE